MMNPEMSDAISITTIRNAVVADIPAMMRIAGSTSMASQWSEQQYFDLFAPEPPHHFALVVEQDSRIAGFLAGRSFREEYEIENIAVSAVVQRQGLGTKLLKEFLEIARENLPVKVFLEVRESNVVARALYAKFGFRKIGERRSYYHNPEESALNYQLLIP